MRRVMFLSKDTPDIATAYKCGVIRSFGVVSKAVGHTGRPVGHVGPCLQAFTRYISTVSSQSSDRTFEEKDHLTHCTSSCIKPDGHAPLIIHQRAFTHEAASIQRLLKYRGIGQCKSR